MEAKQETQAPVDLRTKIQKVLSEILSDKHECCVVLRFEKKVPHEKT